MDIIESLRYCDVVYIVAGCIRLISIGVIAFFGLVCPSWFLQKNNNYLYYVNW